MRITGGLLKNHVLKTPKGLNTRPTSEKLRQTVFNICQHHIEKATFLDLFAGSGAMGIEALSRGATAATFVENNRLALKTIQDNLKSLDLSSQATLIAGDVLSSLEKIQGSTFDLIYVDPPYGKGLHEETLKSLDRLKLLASGGILFVEECSLDETIPLQTLSLKKKRKVGSTFLYEFISLL